jgi:anti-sigma factor RsiW
MNGGAIEEYEFLAYADGLLPEERRASVAAALAGNPERAADVAAWQRQNETLRGLYPVVARDSTPAALSPHRIGRDIRTGRARNLRMAVAATLLVAAGGLAGWFGRELAAGVPQAGFSLVGEAMAAHSLYTREVVHAVEVKADQEQHLASWLSKRLDRPLVIPDLRQEGLAFIGGRLLPANGGPAAQYMYEDEGGNRVTFYIVPAPGKAETALRYVSGDGLVSYLWTDNALDCAIVSDLPRERVQQIAMSAYKQFE